MGREVYMANWRGCVKTNVPVVIEITLGVKARRERPKGGRDD